MTKPITFKEYCPKARGIMTFQEYIRYQVGIEDEWNHTHTPAPIPKFKKIELKWTPASLVGMAGNCLKALIP